MLKDRLVFLNNDFIPWNQAQVHMLSHSFSRGSAIFEVLGIHKTDQGAAVFRLDTHIERFFESARLLEMELRLTPAELHQAALETIKRNHIEEGFIKIMGFYPQIALEILPPQPDLDAAIFAIDPAQDLGALHFPFEKGTTLCISKWRKLDPQTIPIEAKVSGNYMNGFMARQEGRKRGFLSAIMLDTQGFIAEGGTECIFLVKDGRLYTPATGTILKSITRRSILELAGVLGIEAYERRLLPGLCWEAQELFLSGTPMKVLPVRKVEERELQEVPGPLSRCLMEAMHRITAGRDERFGHWLTLLK